MGELLVSQNGRFRVMLDASGVDRLDRSLLFAPVSMIIGAAGHASCWARISMPNLPGQTAQDLGLRWLWIGFTA